VLGHITRLSLSTVEWSPPTTPFCTLSVWGKFQHIIMLLHHVTTTIAYSKKKRKEKKNTVSFHHSRRAGGRAGNILTRPWDELSSHKTPSLYSYMGGIHLTSFNVFRLRNPHPPWSKLSRVGMTRFENHQARPGMKPGVHSC
jgi:hypothetical protein